MSGGDADLGRGVPGPVDQGEPAGVEGLAPVSAVVGSTAPSTAASNSLEPACGSPGPGRRPSNSATTCRWRRTLEGGPRTSCSVARMAIPVTAIPGPVASGCGRWGGVLRCRRDADAGQQRAAPGGVLRHCRGHPGGAGRLWTRPATGRPTVREADIRGGTGRPRSERRQPKGTRKARHHDRTLQYRSPAYNWPHTRPECPGPKGS